MGLESRFYLWRGIRVSTSRSIFASLSGPSYAASFPEASFPYPGRCLPLEPYWISCTVHRVVDELAVPYRLRNRSGTLGSCVWARGALYIGAP
jgi:hypothetical protein